MADFGRVKTWGNEVLQPADLNAEFDNIINNVTANSINAANIDETAAYTWSGATIVNAAWTFNENSADVDLRAEGANNANMIVLDAGQDALSFGGANVDGAAFTLNNLQQRTHITSVGSQLHVPAQTTDFDNASGTIAIGSGAFFGIPTWTNANATLTMTDLATVYIQGAPVDSTNVTATNTAKALWVDGGLTALDGAVTMGSTLEMTGDLTLLDNVNLTFGTGGDVDIDYNGTDLVMNLNVAGTGDFVINNGSVEFDDSEGVTLGTGKDATLQYDGTHVVMNTRAVGTGNFNPGADDGGAIGTSGTAWSDVFLATGAVINFNAGAETITHSANTLTFGGITTLSLDIATIDLVTTGNRIDFDTDNDTSIRASADDVMQFETAGSDRVTIDSAGSVYINDSANADMTVGLTINQGANDDSIFALKSSDVDHKQTDFFQTHTFLNIEKDNAVTGGAVINVMSEGNAGLVLHSRPGAIQTTDTGSSLAACTIKAQQWDGGTNVIAAPATSNIFAVTDGTTTRFLVKGNGALHATNVTSGQLDGTALDAEDDIGLIRTFERTIHNDIGIIMSKWDEQLDVHEEDLRRVGVFKGDFYCMQRMDSLLGGGIWKNHCDIQELREELDSTRSELAETQAQLKRISA